MASRKIEVAITGDARSLERAFGRSGKAADTFQKKLGRIGKNITSVGQRMTLGVTLPIVGVGTAAVKMAMDFDESMTKMVSLVGLSRDEVNGMRKDVLTMASQYGKSGKEAAEAMFFITSAGLRGANAMETLEASLKGAAIGLGDVKTIADLATSAMNAYGVENLSATEATSILRTAVEQGKLESTELAGAMGAVLPIASALGVGFDEVAGGMAAMSRTGTNAAQASTALTSIMMSLTKETPKGKKALDEVGLSYEGLRKQIKDKGLLSVLQTLVSSFGDNTIATEKLFGNKRALLGVMDLMGEGAETTADIFGALAATTADDLNPALEAASDTSAFKLSQAIATLKNTLIEFGDIIAPTLGTLAQYASRAANAFGELSPRTKNLIVVGALIAAAIGPVLIIVGSLITVIAALITPIGLIVAGIAAAAVAFGVFYAKSETFRNAINSIAGAVASRMPQVRAVMEDVMGWLNANVVPTVESIARNVGRVLGVLAKIWSDHGETIKRIVGPVLRSLLAIITMVLGNIKSVVEIALALLRGDFSAAFEGIKDIVKRVLNTIVTIVKNMGPLLLDAAKLLGNAVLNGIIAGLGAIVRRVKGKLDENKQAISQAAGEAYTAALDIGRQVISGILGGLGGLYNAVKDRLRESLRGAIDFVRNNLGSTVAQYTARTIGIDIPDGIIAGIEKRRTKVVGKLKAVVRQAVHEAAREARANLGSLTSGLAGMLGRLFESVSPEARRLAQLRADIEADEESRTRKRLQESIDQVKERADVEADFLDRVTGAETRAARERAKVEERLADDLKKARSRAARAEAQAEFARAVREIEEAKNDDIMSATMDKNRRLSELDAQRMQAQEDMADFERQLEVRNTERFIEDRKNAYETDIANLTEQFNRGEITAEQFRDALNNLIGGQTGAELGAAFAGEFERQLRAVTQQIRALVGFGGGIAGPGVVSPGAAGTAAQLKAWEKRRDAYHAARVNFYKRKESDQGGTVTAREKTLINAEMDAWRKSNPKPRALADGGILRTAVLAGEAGPEAVLPLSSGRARRMLADALDGADKLRGDSGGNVVVHVTVNGNEFSAAEFARKLAPELRRQVSLIRSA